MTDFAQLLPLAMLGAVLGLDVVSFPQAMISRPIVAATAAATLLGDPGRGLLVGATANPEPEQPVRINDDAPPQRLSLFSTSSSTERIRRTATT